MRYTFEQVKTSFYSEGYSLLSSEYINGSRKLDYKCPNGHVHSITFYNWNAGYRCPFCVTDQRRANITHIEAALAGEGYKLITDRYVNNKQRLECICDQGHECTITWAGWNSRGDRCNTCGYERMALKQTGPGNCQWHGGIARLPYCYDWTNKEFKDYIKDRDDHTCQRCGVCSDLVIHHVDYIKANCNRENLITLCRGCNTAVNKHRSKHTKLFRELLTKKFNYGYL